MPEFPGLTDALAKRVANRVQRELRMTVEAGDVQAVFADDMANGRLRLMSWELCSAIRSELRELGLTPDA